MTNDITLLDETAPAIEETAIEETAAPPLCLVHYFGATGQGPPAAPSLGRIAERDGNLIILEFAPPPRVTLGKPRKRFLRKGADALVLLLLLTCLVACVAALRF